jgi:hypothetical protein
MPRRIIANSCGFKFQRFGVRCRQLPRSSFKPLVPDHEPIAIPEDCLHGVAAFVDEEEQVAAQRIELKLLLHNPEQAIETLSHVNRLCAEEQFGARWETQHGGTSLAILSHDVTAVFFPGI